MKNIQEIPIMESKNAINIVRNTLKLLDKRLVNHGERVAYILYRMLSELDQYSEQDRKNICLLGLFHDIGAYKTEEIDKLVQFETDTILEHSIYGSLFLKYFTPLDAMWEGVLYHHIRLKDYDKFSTKYQDIALMINLVDRIDMLIQNNDCVNYIKLEELGGKIFSSSHIELFKFCDLKYQITEKIVNKTYELEIEELIENLHLTYEEINCYLNMLVYSIDFRSVHTVNHTINTVSISLEISKLLNYDAEEQMKIYYGALLHDIGKIAIPTEILEFPGKLSPDAMDIMRTHIIKTREIISGYLPQEICDIAVRHHEKLDGSGYPDQLKAHELTESQRIVAIADIISALSGRRSYKDAFSDTKIIQILNEMSDDGKICPKVCNLVIEHYDEIMSNVKKDIEPILSTYSKIMEEYELIYQEFNHILQK